MPVVITAKKKAPANKKKTAPKKPLKKGVPSSVTKKTAQRRATERKSNDGSGKYLK